MIRLLFLWLFFFLAPTFMGLAVTSTPNAPTTTAIVSLAPRLKERTRILHDVIHSLIDRESEPMMVLVSDSKLGPKVLFVSEP